MEPARAVWTPYLWNGTDDVLWELRVDDSTDLSPYPLDAFAQPPASGTATAFGAGCAAPSGQVPVFGAPDPSQLIPGGQLDVHLGSATVGAAALSFLGDSRTSWAGSPLPVTWPGTSCSFYTNHRTSAVQAVGPAGTASWSWPIPSGGAFAGAVLYAQWGVLEGGGSLPPFTLSQAYQISVGAGVPPRYETVSNTTGGSTGVKSTGVKSTLGHLGIAARLVVN